MGAALQSLYAVTALVEYTFDAYRYVAVVFGGCSCVDIERMMKHT